MHAGLRHRSDLLRALDDADRADVSLSAAALALARTVIDATDKSLQETAQDPADGAEAGIKLKSVGDYVTALDLNLDRHLSRELMAMSDLPIVSEEGAEVADLHSLPEAWLIDPLDGTTASLCGEMGLCGPMVTRLRHGEPQLSVMLSLDGTTLAIADRGAGAAVLRVTVDGSRWLPATGFQAIDRLRDGCLLLNPQSDSSRSHRAFVTLHNALRTGAHTMAIESRVPHSMAALALGTGRRLAVIHDNSVDFPKQMAWDVLPVQLWVEERGGVYWGIDGNRYDIRRPLPIIAATRADIATQLIDLAGP